MIKNLLSIFFLFTWIASAPASDSEDRLTDSELIKSIKQDFYFDKSLSEASIRTFIKDMFLLRRLPDDGAFFLLAELMGTKDLSGESIYQVFKDNVFLLAGGSLELRGCMLKEDTELCDLDDKASLFIVPEGKEVIQSDPHGFSSFIGYPDDYIGVTGIVSSDNKHMPLSDPSQGYFVFQMDSKKIPSVFKDQTYGSSLLRISHYIGISHAAKSKSITFCSTHIPGKTYECDTALKGPYLITALLLDKFSSSCSKYCSETEISIMRYLAASYYLRLKENPSFSRAGFDLIKDHAEAWQDISLNTKALMEIRLYLLSTTNIY